MHSQRAQGVAFIIGAAFFFALMSFFVRLSGDLPTFQKALFRNIVAAAIALITLIRSGQKIQFHRERIPSLLLRSIFGTIGLLCNFYAVCKMNIADANMLNKLAPFFAVIMSTFVLKERADKLEYGAVALAFIGALFVIKPSFNVEFVYALIGCTGGLCAGVAYTYVRKLGKMGERGVVIVFFFSVFSTLVCLPFALLEYRPMLPAQALALLGAGAAAAGGQFCVTAAYAKAPASEISVYDYSQVIFAALLGLLFLHQIPDGWSALGYVIIIGTAVAKWRYGQRKAHRTGGSD